MLSSCGYKAAIDNEKENQVCEIVSSYSGSFTQNVGSTGYYTDNNQIKKIFQNNITFNKSKKYSFPYDAKVLLVLSNYSGNSSKIIISKTNIEENNINLEVEYDINLISSSVMNQPFYLLISTKNCKIKFHGK